MAGKNILLFFCLCISYSTFSQKSSLNKGEILQDDYHAIIRYESVKGKIIVPVEVNGKLRRFIVDTGAPLMLSHSLYNELQPRMIEKIQIKDQSGLTDSLWVVALDTLKLGTVTFVNTPAIVAQKNSLLFDCFEVDGFIGSNLLRNSILKISGADSTLTITNDLKRVKPRRFLKKTKLFLNRQSNPYIWVDAGKKNRLQVLIDTGMEGFFDLSMAHFISLKDKNVFPDIYEATGSYSLGLNGAANDTLQYQVLLPKLTVDGTAIKDFVTQTTSSRNSRLGSDILTYGSIVLDYRSRKFFFEPYIKGSISLNKKPQDFQLVLKEDHLEIGIIWNKELEKRIEVVLEIQEKLQN